MAFHKYGRTYTVPRDRHVAIVVREVTLNADAPESQRVEAVEIREYLKEGEIWGHGITVPAAMSKPLRDAIASATRKKPEEAQ